MTETRGVQLEALSRHWRPLLLVVWIGVAAWLLFSRWAAIRGFALGDTDDNMRIMQVRALLDGQGWYDLRQYRLSPPGGADIHWSRVVDLPIAAIKLLLAPLIGGRDAEQAAVAIAPLLPMLVAMSAVAVIARRLIDGKAWVVALALLVCAGSARGMWSPLRIDHHGWQLAVLAVALAALTDDRRARGGALLGAATALSLAIGMEMLLYLALAGGMTVLRWILDREQARRLLAYGAALGGGTALAFLVFASEANRAPVCDALSPVWLSAMAAVGAITVALAFASPSHWRPRLAAAAAAGVALAAAFAWAWPDCLGRLEGASAELQFLWLDRVREALPLWRHGARTAAVIATLPIAGLIGYGFMIWKHRGDRDRLIVWASLALPALLAAALLLWQTRAAAASQLLSIPGATALVWSLIVWLLGLRSPVARVAIGLAVFLVASGSVTGYVVESFPAPLSDYRRSVLLANARCATLAALRPIARQPRGTVLTFVDLGPRLITVTPHNAIIGPYHRNERQIVDVMRAWRGDLANARATIERYGVDYVLICPNMSESTTYRADAPDGFYAQLLGGRAPPWLQPVPLPAGSPFRMWRVARAPTAS